MDVSTIILFCSVLSSTLRNSAAVVDTIRAHQPIRDGETITSAGGDFELGFFSPGNSTNRYLGIWYKKISNGTVVWVANRDIPIMNKSGMASVNDKGITLQTVNGIIWSSNMSLPIKNPVAQLLDSGNLILRNEDQDTNNAENFVWQSFDHIGDTLLPGMKLGVDLVTGLNRYTSSWKSVDDPSTGSFTDRLDPTGFPQLFLLDGSTIWSRPGPWTGLQFSGNPRSNPNGMYQEKFVINEKEIYYKFDLINRPTADIRFLLTPNGEIKFFVWNYQIQNWMVYVTLLDLFPNSQRSGKQLTGLVDVFVKPC